LAHSVACTFPISVGWRDLPCPEAQGPAQHLAARLTVQPALAFLSSACWSFLGLHVLSRGGVRVGGERWSFLGLRFSPRPAASFLKP
jgi:hypothetical protein